MPIRNDAIKFLTLYQRLTDQISEPDDSLRELAKKKPKIRTLCHDLYWCHSGLSSYARLVPDGLISPVDPAFVTAWRDYEERLHSIIFDIEFEEVLKELEEDDSTERTVEGPADELDHFAEDAHEKAKALEHFIDLAFENARERDYDESFNAVIESAEFAWSDLTREIRIDFEGILRRAARFPVLLVPRQVASQYGVGDDLSLAKLWSDAQLSFIYGAHRGSLAIARAILEIVCLATTRSKVRTSRNGLQIWSRAIPRSERNNSTGFAGLGMPFFTRICSNVVGKAKPGSSFEMPRSEKISRNLKRA